MSSAPPPPPMMTKADPKDIEMAKLKRQVEQLERETEALKAQVSKQDKELGTMRKELFLSTPIIQNIRQVDWETTEHIMTLKADSSVLCIITKQGSVVVKRITDSKAFLEVFASSLLTALFDIETPQARVLSRSSVEFGDIQEALSSAVDISQWGGVLVMQTISGETLMKADLERHLGPGRGVVEEEFNVAGPNQTPSSDSSCNMTLDVVLGDITPQGHKILQDMGRLTAFDVLINNFDRFAFGSVWSHNSVNFGNMMFREGEVVGIDQALRPLNQHHPRMHEALQHSRGMVTAAKLVEAQVDWVSQYVTTRAAVTDVSLRLERLCFQAEAMHKVQRRWNLARFGTEVNNDAELLQVCWDLHENLTAIVADLEPAVEALMARVANGEGSRVAKKHEVAVRSHRIHKAMRTMNMHVEGLQTELSQLEQVLNGEDSEALAEMVKGVPTLETYLTRVEESIDDVISHAESQSDAFLMLRQWIKFHRQYDIGEQGALSLQLGFLEGMLQLANSRDEFLAALEANRTAFAEDFLQDPQPLGGSHNSSSINSNAMDAQVRYELESLTDEYFAAVLDVFASKEAVLAKHEAFVLERKASVSLSLRSMENRSESLSLTESISIM